jgi:tetratricopeptide (TPR) repeat protein
MLETRDLALQQSIGTFWGQAMKMHRDPGFTVGYSSFWPIGLLVLLSCAAPAASTTGGHASQSDPTDVVDARRVLKRALERTSLVSDVVFHTDSGEPRSIEYTDQNHSRRAVELYFVLSDSIDTSYSPGSATIAPAWRISYTNYQDRKPYYWLSSSWSQSDAEIAARAFKVLVRDARQNLDKLIGVGFAKFLVTCQSWRGLQQKPAMPEEARRHKVLAENAYREKNLDKATTEYIDALDVYPCWPEGQFNVALMLGETGYYPMAVSRMKRYLELVPDAADAAAAKDKIIIWQDKIGR